MRILIKFCCTGLLSATVLLSAEILPPGERPISIGVHALVGGRIVIKPGVLIEDGTIIIRNGRVESVFENGKIAIPLDCRSWNMSGKTIYAGFIDPYLSFGEDKAKPVSNRWTIPIDARSGINFKGFVLPDSWGTQCHLG